MIQETDLASWRKMADSQLTPIEKVKKNALVNGQRLDRENPDWRAKKDTAPTEYPKHDARREYFTTIRVILQNAQ